MYVKRKVQKDFISRFRYRYISLNLIWLVSLEMQRPVAVLWLGSVQLALRAERYSFSPLAAFLLALAVPVEFDHFALLLLLLSHGFLSRSENQLCNAVEHLRWKKEKRRVRETIGKKDRA